MVDKSDVKEVAENARINLEDGETEKFAEDFENILEMFETIDEIDTEDVEPAFHPVDVKPKSRDDKPGDSLEKEQVFKNTENEEDGYFKGPSA